MLNTERFGALVRELRESRRLTQAAVDEAGGPSRQVIIEIEQGQPNELTDATLRKLDVGLRLPSDFCHSVLTTEHGPGEDYRVADRRFSRDAGTGRPTLGFQADDGEALDLPASMVTNDVELQALAPALQHGASHLLLDINVLGDMTDGYGRGQYFVERWEKAHTRHTDGAALGALTTTLRAATLRRTVIDPFAAVETLSDARDLLASLGHDVTNAEGAAVAALFVAYAAQRLRIPGPDILAVLNNWDRINNLGTRLDLAQPDRCIDARIHADSAERDEDGQITSAHPSAEELAEDLVVLWKRFFHAVGLGVDVAVSDAIGGLRDLITQRSAVSEIVLSSNPGGSPIVYWSPALPISQAVGHSPVGIVYDSEVFPRLPALLAWAGTRSRAVAKFVTVSTSAVSGVRSRDAAVILVDPAEDVELLEAVQRRGGVSFTHLYPRPDGWMGVLTQSTENRVRSTPVFIPED